MLKQSALGSTPGLLTSPIVQGRLYRTTQESFTLQHIISRCSESKVP
jgi:hypothetical protein